MSLISYFFPSPSPPSIYLKFFGVGFRRSIFILKNNFTISVSYILVTRTSDLISFFLILLTIDAIPIFNITSYIFVAYFIFLRPFTYPSKHSYFRYTHTLLFFLSTTQNPTLETIYYI